jgi:tetratricopeptide (TPR) repeat protein
MGIRDSFLLAALSARLDTRLKGVDLADGAAGLTALDGVAAEDAARLRQLLEQSCGANLVATVVLFKFHALRHYLLPVAEGLEDLWIATQMVGILLSTKPALVPEAFRACRNGDEAAALLLADRAQRILQDGGVAADRSELDQAVGLLGIAVRHLPVGSPHRGPVLSRLSAAYLARYLRFEDPEDCEQAVDTGREAVQRSSSPSDLARARFNLGQALLARFTRLTLRSDLEAAIDVLRSSVSATPESHPGYEQRHSRLAIAQETAEHVFGILDDGVAISRAVLQIKDADDPRRAQRLEGLAFFLIARFNKSGSLSDLDEGIDALREAIAASAADDEELPWRKVKLGESLRWRAQHTGADTDLDEAVNVTREALDLLPEGDHRRAGCLGVLAGHLRVRAERTSSLEDLDEAIRLGRLAVALGTDPDREKDPYGTESPLTGTRHVSMVNLTGALGTRFAWLGTLSDLRESIDVCRAAVAAADTSTRALCLSNLSVSLHRLFAWSQEPDDLEEALEAARAAVDACVPSDQDRRRYLANLAGLLMARATLGVGSATDADDAVAVNRAALDLTPPGHEDRPRWNANHALLLRNRAERSRSAGDAAQAVALAQEALAALPAVHTDRGSLMITLAACLHLHADLTASPSGARQAIELWREAAEMTTSPVMVRITAARAAGYAAASLDPADGTAADLYEAAVGLLPLVASPAIERRSQEQRLESVMDVAGDAAACALSTGRAVRAVELLEQGRNLIWNQTLNTHDDFADLRAHHPELAARLITVALGLNDMHLDEMDLLWPTAQP